jgi:hypothetical protein
MCLSRSLDTRTFRCRRLLLIYCQGKVPTAYLAAVTSAREIARRVGKFVRNGVEQIGAVAFPGDCQY